MDGSHFDTLTRSLSTAGSRRRALGRLLAGTLGLLGWQDQEDTIAHELKDKCKKKSGDAKKKCLKKAKKHAAQHASETSPPPPPPCVRTCNQRSCGENDGCGGRCITDRGCDAGTKCSAAGACVPDRCSSDCAGKVCGADDGCGGTCVTDLGCDTGKSCSQDGECVPDVCTPVCVDKSCGDPDGCGGTCQTQQGCGEGKGCCPDGCVDLLNDPSNCTYCGYECADDCCCQGACMPPGWPYCTCDCCRIDEDEKPG
jgi:hypothetical protein